MHKLIGCSAEMNIMLNTEHEHNTNWTNKIHYLISLEWIEMPQHIKFTYLNCIGTNPMFTKKAHAWMKKVETGVRT